ncbi:MAG: hypothetical protein EG825_14875 [Rhodocyclaceae bacterium]|nr:hypothetical protein [Rhodocyclaceae bacterium]
METAEPNYSICYLLDENDVIVDISQGWDDFARENAAPHLDASNVIGRNLIDFVSGDETKMYVRAILNSARLFRRPMVRTYRCDSPDQRRYMEMRLTIVDDNLIKWEHRMVRSESLQRRMRFRVAAGFDAGKLIVRCSVCNRLKSGSSWHEPDQAPLTPTEGEEEYLVAYGVCPDCQGKFSREAIR